MVGNRREYITGRDHAHSKQSRGSVPSGSTPLYPAVAETTAGPSAPLKMLRSELVTFFDFPCSLWPESSE
jgi:hypothetical protein